MFIFPAKKELISNIFLLSILLSKYSPLQLKSQEDTKKNIIFLYGTVEKGFELRYIKIVYHPRGVAQWLSASALGAESRGFDPRRPDHFFCSLQSSPLWLDFLSPRLLWLNDNDLRRTVPSGREQRETAVFSVSACVSHRIGPDSLKRQVCRPLCRKDLLGVRD